MSVIDDGQADELDKGVSGITLTDASQEHLKIKVQFSDTESITSDITDPDLLQIKILKPGLFVDAETLEPIDLPDMKAEVELKPQLS